MVPDSMRLHITPLNPDLVKAVVGTHLLDSLSNLSYHKIATFPENNYGYLEVPRMEGEKLKKKLNGAILKGQKIKIEEARPNKRRRLETSEDKEDEANTPKLARKGKKERNVLAGRDLSPGRKVKRGWTERKSAKSSKTTKDKSSSRSSKYTDKEEILFRTNVPPNKVDAAKITKEKRKSKKNNHGRQVVHEFEKSQTQPSFLKQDVGLGITGNLQYIEGQGWIDEAGHTVEEESERVSRKREATKSRTRSKRKLADEADPAPSTFKCEEEQADGDGGKEVTNVTNVEDNETSSSGSSLDSDADPSAKQSESALSALASDEQVFLGRAEVHPLEALFKKPQKPGSQDIAKPSLEISTGFSFFDAGEGDDLEDEPTIPLTPFSSQEFRSRGLRSAAPTPDTAFPSRFNSYGSSGLPGDEDMEEDDGLVADVVIPKGTSAGTSSRSQSDFEKKFWENRAENNRAWKLRRRTVLKEKRQRENKARRPKNW